MRPRLFWLALLAAALVPLGPGCSDTALDCRDVCSRYRECLSRSYDVAACEDRCRASARRDPEFERKLDRCEACIRGRACTDAIAACAVDCVGVVP